MVVLADDALLELSSSLWVSLASSLLVESCGKAGQGGAAQVRSSPSTRLAGLRNTLQPSNPLFSQLWRWVQSLSLPLTTPRLSFAFHARSTTSKPSDESQGCLGSLWLQGKRFRIRSFQLSILHSNLDRLSSHTCKRQQSTRMATVNGKSTTLPPSSFLCVPLGRY